MSSVEILKTIGLTFLALIVNHFAIKYLMDVFYHPYWPKSKHKKPNDK